MNNVVIRLPIILTYAMFLGFIAGCVAPQIRNGELFVATRRQFSLVNEAWHANDSRMNPGAILAPFVMVGGSLIGVTYAPVADFFCIPYDMNIRKGLLTIRSMRRPYVNLDCQEKDITIRNGTIIVFHLRKVTKHPLLRVRNHWN